MQYFLSYTKEKMEAPTDEQLLNFCLGILSCTRKEIEERYLSVRDLNKTTRDTNPIWSSTKQVIVRICDEQGRSSYDEKLLEVHPELQLPTFSKSRIVLTREPRKILSAFVGEDKVEVLSKIGNVKNLETVSFSEEQLGEDMKQVVGRIRCINPHVQVFLHPEKEQTKKRAEVAPEKPKVVKWGSVSLYEFTYCKKFFPAGWSDFFKDSKGKIKQISSALEGETDKKFTPPLLSVWKAFQETPRDEVRVVIIGQDPYPTPGDAMGMAFSVKAGRKIAASLANIAKEVEKQGFKTSGSGDLTCWAKQGVLLLNTALTTVEKERASHISIWDDFSRDVVKHLNETCSAVVYILWGSEARKFRDIINAKRNLVLECGHPSPLSVEKFRGNNHFVLANEYLKGAGKKEIDWSF